MIIKEADFIGSAVKIKNCPPSGPPEIAFAGRSNVGKSSLINTLVGRKNLAKTSSTPGRTRTLNLYLINQAFYFVDLPGYGYAKVSPQERRAWRPMVENYLRSGRPLAAVVLILDIRRNPEEEEFQFLDWLNENNILVHIVLTKTDKISSNRRKNRILDIANQLGLPTSQIFLFSAISRYGREDILAALEKALDL